MTSLVIAVPHRPGVLLDAGVIRTTVAPRPIAALLRAPSARQPTQAAIRSG